MRNLSGQRELSEEQVDAIIASIAPSLSGLTVHESRQIQMALSRYSDESIVGDCAIVNPVLSALEREENDKLPQLEISQNESVRRLKLIEKMAHEYCINLIGFSIHEIEHFSSMIVSEVKYNHVVGDEKPLPEGLESWNS